MSRQYVRCRFNEWDRREYTYHHDGEPLKRGDSVLVASPRGDQTVTVVGFVDVRPRFETKPVLVKVADGKPPEPVQRTLL